MSPDVHALTGAYVLDAVSDLERASFERHLAECSACTQEVRELRETATRLGRAAEAEPPVYLKGQVLASIRSVRQLPPEMSGGNGRHRASPRWTLRLMSAAAAVLFVVAAVLGVLLVREQDSASDSRALASLVTSADAHVAEGTAEGGGTATVIYSRALNRALVLTSGMPSAPDGKDYQAWVIGADDQMHSAGLLSRSGTSTVTLSDIASAKGFGVTIEPTGGSKSPSLPPIMKVDFA